MCLVAQAVNGECVLCDGPCPKMCEGQQIIHSGNIDSFKDCTVIEGFILILDQSFEGYQQVYANYSFGERYQKMHPDRLEVFSTLKEVTGYISIQGSHSDFKNLSYFRLVAPPLSSFCLPPSSAVTSPPCMPVTTLSYSCCLPYHQHTSSPSLLSDWSIQL